ncbi:MAG TPA: hypothetical protein VL985_19870, partial [Stellaceae bacterium]|nr:hypothetical protein [Stellaceae bacterium]
GRIEAVAAPEENLFQPHSWPYPTDGDGPCPGFVARRTVLGTDFRTDVALFSLPLDAPFRVRPDNDETASALRTICEALAKAACRLLQVESSEILAEYRPAITEAGANGLEAEVFIYDTLAGAGFSPQLVNSGQKLIEDALNILTTYPDGLNPVTVVLRENCASIDTVSQAAFRAAQPAGGIADPCQTAVILAVRAAWM